MAVLLTAALALVACGSESGAMQQSPEAIEAGRTQFARLCSTCHGRDGAGMPGLGRSLRANAFVRDKTDEELVDFIARGRSTADPANLTGIEMPPRGGDPGLSDWQLLEIVAYLRTF